MPTPFEIQNSEIHDIIGKMPHWVIRWGISILLGLLLVFLASSFIISYNDSVAGEVSIKQEANNDGIQKTTVTVPLSSFGRIKPGQEVLISLTAYAYQDFGYLKGNVESLEPLKDDKKAYVTIALPKGLLTDHNVNIPAHPVLTGRAEIILQKRSLFQHIFSF